MRISLFDVNAFFRKQRIIGCLIIGVITTGLSLSMNLWQNALVFAVLAVLMMPSEVQVRKTFFIVAGWFAASSVTTFLIVQLTANARIHAVGLKNISFNLVVIMIVFLIVYTLCGRVRAASIGTAAFLVLFATVDYYVLRFRGRQISPADVLSFRTAMNVAGQFNFIPGATLVFSWIQLIEYAVICLEIRFKPNSAKSGLRIATAAAALLLAPVAFVGICSIKPYQFGIVGANFNGFLLNFLAEIRSMKVEKPEGYSDDELFSIEQAYLNEETEEVTSHEPDIIVIMNESFADLGILGDSPRTNQEVTPFLNSLTDNTVRGYALSSVFGGDTANSEYEFLTGNSMYFLPSNSIPFQQFVNDQRWSLAWFLRNKGYYTLAMHPFSSSGWMRTTAWPYLGFEEYDFIDEFPQKDMLRGYVSDSEMYEHLFSRYEEIALEDNTPVFIFGVTMQNHGGYEYVGNDFNSTIELIGYNNPYPSAEHYLSLLHESDAALEELLNYYSNVDREVILVFFGDHLPSLEEDFFRELHGGELDSPEETALMYKVPYIIWANYDIDEETDVDTSINFLSAKMLEAAGADMNAYHRFLLKVSESVPEISAWGYISESNDTYWPKETSEDILKNLEEVDILRDYSYLQYNNMFGEDVNYDFYQCMTNEPE